MTPWQHSLSPVLVDDSTHLDVRSVGQFLLSHRYAKWHHYAKHLLSKLSAECDTVADALCGNTVHVIPTNVIPAETGSCRAQPCGATHPRRRAVHLGVWRRREAGPRPRRPRGHPAAGAHAVECCRDVCQVL